MREKVDWAWLARIAKVRAPDITAIVCFLAATCQAIPHNPSLLPFETFANFCWEGETEGIQKLMKARLRKESNKTSNTRSCPLSPGHALSIRFVRTSDILCSRTTPLGRQTGYPFICPIRGCRKAGAPTKPLKNHCPQAQNLRPRAWARERVPGLPAPPTRWNETQAHQANCYTNNSASRTFHEGQKHI